MENKRTYKTCLRAFFAVQMTAILMSCNEGEAQAPNDPDGARICLRSAIGKSRSDWGTRASIAADAYYETVPTENHPLFADVWFSTVSGSYPGTQVASKPDNYIDVHRQIEYMDGSSTYPEPVDNVYLQYPLDESVPVYCVGFYPQNAWSVSDDGLRATATVNGKDDLMFATQIEGKKLDGDFLSSKQQLYRHLQTWIKVSVHADESVSPEAWGKITRIRVRSKANMTVTLGNTTDGAPDCDEEDTWITAYEAGEEGGHAFNTTVEEIGSVFVTPVTGTGDSPAVCDVEVTTEKVPEPKVATIRMLDYDGQPYLGNTIGNLFVLIVDLKTPVIIEGTATLTPWSDEESRLTLDGEIPELVLNVMTGQPGHTHTVTGITLPTSATRMEVTTAEDNDIVTVGEIGSLTAFTLTAKEIGKTRLTLKAYDGSGTLIKTLPYNVTVTADTEAKTVQSGSSVEVKGLLMPENTASVAVSCGDGGKVTPSVEYRASTHTAILTLWGFGNTVADTPAKVTVTAKDAGDNALYSRSFDVTVGGVSEEELNVSVNYNSSSESNTLNVPITTDHLDFVYADAGLISCEQVDGIDSSTIPSSAKFKIKNLSPIDGDTTSVTVQAMGGGDPAEVLYSRAYYKITLTNRDQIWLSWNGTNNTRSDTLTLPATTENVTAQSSNESVCTCLYDKEAQELTVTAIAKGTATVTVKGTDVDGNVVYKKVYTVNVSTYSPTK